MTVEIMSVITIISVACSIVFGYKAYSRNKTQDEKADASQNTLIMFKLDSIDSKVNELTTDYKSTRQTIQDIRERTLLLEKSQDEFSKRLNKVETNRLMEHVEMG